MRIDKQIMIKINSAMADLNYKHRQSNGVENYVNAAIKEGIELRGLDISPFAVDTDGTRIYDLNQCGNETRLAVTTIEDILNLPAYDQDEGAIAPECTDLVTSIVPQYLTDAIIEKHPGTISALIHMQQTDPRQIKKRTGPKGTVLKYVDTAYMTVALNYATLMDWSFEVMETRTDVIEGKTHISVLGCVTLHTTEGDTIVKQQWGSQVLKMGMEMGDALKAAASDAMKKCASMYGIAADVYGGVV